MNDPIRVCIKSEEEWNIINKLFDLKWKTSDISYNNIHSYTGDIVVIIRNDSYAKYSSRNLYTDAEVLSFYQAVALKVNIPKIKIL